MTARVTGIQAATAALRAQLESYRELLGPREYATVVQIHAQLVERELRRVERLERRRSP